MAQELKFFTNVPIVVQTLEFLADSTIFATNVVPNKIGKQVLNIVRQSLKKNMIFFDICGVRVLIEAVNLMKKLKDYFLVCIKEK